MIHMLLLSRLENVIKKCNYTEKRVYRALTFREYVKSMGKQKTLEIGIRAVIISDINKKMQNEF